MSTRATFEDSARDTSPGGTAGRALEQIMNTPTVIRNDPPETPGSTGSRGAHHRAGRRNWIFGGAGLGTAAAVAAIIALSSGGGTTPSRSTVELDLATDDIMASCLPVSPELLVDMDIVFAGTVQSVDGETITLDVSRWYAGGDADLAVLTAPAGMEALIGGISFEAGGTYLVSATADGTVNYCGYTGAATPELQAIYDAAFPG